jgi:hypothetical protein
MLNLSVPFGFIYYTNECFDVIINIRMYSGVYGIFKGIVKEYVSCNI